MQYPERENSNIILNIAGGKIGPIDDYKDKSFFLVNLDLSYKSRLVPLEEIERCYIETFYNKITNDFVFYCNEDIFEYLDTTLIPYNWICLYRFLEHIPQTKVLYFMYQLSRVVPKNGIVDCIVPDFKYLANLMLSETLDDIKNESKNIYITTELLNEIPDPHQSIWTKDRLKYYWELEGRFEVTNIIEHYTFDQRPYLRAKIKRI